MHKLTGIKTQPVKLSDILREREMGLSKMLFLSISNSGGTEDERITRDGAELCLLLCQGLWEFSLQPDGVSQRLVTHAGSCVMYL